MSATLVSSNTTIKMNAAVSASSTATFGNTMYTAPANGYAIVNVNKAGGVGNATITVGGVRINTATASPLAYQSIYIGPSQSFAWSSGAAEAAGMITISGVEFVNTP